MARKKQSTLPTPPAGPPAAPVATPPPPPDLTGAIEEIMQWWRLYNGSFARANVNRVNWQNAYDDLNTYFPIPPGLKKAEPSVVLQVTANQSGTGLNGNVMILPPLNVASPSVSAMATGKDWKSVLETQQTPIAIFLETDTTDPSHPKDVVHTILVDENHALYDSTTMSEAALSSVFPSFSFVYKAIQKRATTDTAIPPWTIEEFKNIILEGVPGTGKTREFGEIVKEWPKLFSRSAHKRVMTFHPSTSYEDFIVGIRPTAPVSGGSPFAVKPGFIIDVVVEACRNPTEDYLILLDEFNRANVPKVMGDLLTLLEASKRATFDASTAMWETETTVTLPLKFSSPPSSPTASPVGTSASPVPPSTGALLLSEATWGQFFIPDNVYVIGTMNTTDRSVAPLDSALRRRFVFIRIEPLHYKDLETELSAKFGVPMPLIREHTSLWGGLNQWLEKNIGLDAKLGHSYLFEACRVLNKSTRAKSSIALWELLLLPQLQDILMNNHLDANQIDEFNTEIATFLLEKKKLVLRTTGTGVNEMPLLAFE